MVRSAVARWLVSARLRKSGSVRGETELLEISVTYLQRVREESRAVSLDPFTMTMYKGKRRHHRCKLSSIRELSRLNVRGEMLRVELTCVVFIGYLYEHHRC